MKKDNAYYFLIIRTYIESKQITSFADIFKLAPKSVFIQELNMGYYALNKRILNPTLFDLHELNRLSDAIGVDIRVILDLIYVEEKSPGKYRGGPQN